MKIGIAIDPWKLEIFKKHLDRSKLEYKVLPADNSGFALITVETLSPEVLRPYVEEAEKECKRSKMD